MADQVALEVGLVSPRVSPGGHEGVHAQGPDALGRDGPHTVRPGPGLARAGVVAVLGLPELGERLEPRHAAADDAELDLDGGPQPQLEAVPGDIVRLLET